MAVASPSTLYPSDPVGDTVSGLASGADKDAGAGLLFRADGQSGDAYLLLDRPADALLVWLHATWQSVSGSCARRAASGGKLRC